MARDDDAGKRLLYMKSSDRYEPQQARFLGEVQGFSRGYFWPSRFMSCGELVNRVRLDLFDWTTLRVHRGQRAEVLVGALQAKIEYLSWVMERYGVPSDLQ